MSQAAPEGKPDTLTDQHLMLFGKIVQCHARYEGLMREIMAAVSGADVTSIRLLTSGLGFMQLRDALFNLLRHRAMPFDRTEQIRIYLEMPRACAALRNDIAHATWVEGRPQNSIRPLWLTHGPLTAIKPVHDVGDGGKTYIEDDQDRATYTINDLAELERNLAANYEAFRDYVRRVDLLASPAA